MQAGRARTTFKLAVLVRAEFIHTVVINRTAFPGVGIHNRIAQVFRRVCGVRGTACDGCAANRVSG